MLTLRASQDRGSASFDWLESKHSFSFGSYYDPDHMQFGPLRVINEDWIDPAAGFGMHGHKDMEIITYVLDGALEHRDSLGSGSVIRHGDVQRMSAGTGIRHSEFNHSKTEPVHLLQIWIEPERAGLTPSYEERAFAGTIGPGLTLIASRDARDGSLTIHQDVDLYAARPSAGDRIDHAPAAGRKIWVQTARGEIEVNGQRLEAGDGLAIEDETSVTVLARSDAEFLLFDMNRTARHPSA